MTACAECGLDYESMPVPEAIAAIRGFGRRYRAPLTRLLPGEDDSVLRARPAPGTWSALEYAAHVRDVFSWYDERIRRSLAEDRPVIEDPATPNDAAQAGHYNEEDPAAVVDRIAANAERLAATIEAVPADALDRSHRIRGEERSVRFTARRAVHEGSHHILDVGRGLRMLRAARQ
ncbi:MAG: DinB family protein [Acidimicrobiales bacterium]